jgi:hypothetical protein
VRENENWSLVFTMAIYYNNGNTKKINPSTNQHSARLCNCFFERKTRDTTSPNKRTFKQTTFFYGVGRIGMEFPYGERIFGQFENIFDEGSNNQIGILVSKIIDQFSHQRFEQPYLVPSIRPAENGERIRETVQQVLQAEFFL